MKLSSFFAVIMLAGSSFSSFAATEINHSDTNVHQKVGDISVEVQNGTIDDVMNALSSKSDEQGAEYYRVTSVGTAGMGDTMRGTADTYK
ncbi:DUF1471 domain-containing protein [Salmonella enterica]|nr:DUF1471 domain-containing protein [Salmonella enterica]EEH5466054.1 DUF1471 domain-containing protein [Salmonella enterica]EEH7555498.1 DUF1471 domain-containing protein [Salmonella enterica]EEO5639862.1 DUF1471 domain-containing protein [Salmonella enterica]EEQ0204448.1 DUF1471 domain-containing protein [Salmonella enterica]